MSRDSIRTEGVQPMKKEQDLTEETTAGQEPEEAAKAAESEAAAAQEAESASQPEQAEQPEIKQTRTEPDPAEQLAAEKDKYLRLYAEYDNYRKRTAKEKTETYSHATAAAVETLLPALDSFSLALEAACTDEAYKTGMERSIHSSTRRSRSWASGKWKLWELPLIRISTTPSSRRRIRNTKKAWCVRYSRRAI